MKRVIRTSGKIIILLAFTAFLWLIAHLIIQGCGLLWPFLLTPYAEQIITLWLVFGLLILSMVAFSRSARERHHAIWDSLTAIIKQMSSGNFTEAAARKMEKIERDHPVTKLADELTTLALELNEMEKLKQEFISNVSHEIQTPLTSLKGYAHLLKKPDLSYEERGRYLHIIETETERLSKISENLLKLTALERQKEPIQKKPFRIDKQLRRVVLTCEPEWSAKQIEFLIDLKESFVYGDEALLSQVWMNLIHNAVKFTGEGGRISINITDMPEATAVEIADNGIGMEPEQAERVFERFYKADKARNAGGSGLGLSIAHKLVELHGGTIEVESKPGEGTRFRVMLPAEPREKNI
ncbi:HAMP domain-containing histidine kinase [Bacillus sp. YC2]|uniref:sensor histidine kinase n=1 Tax=Bacillus sp. YC2 TaxID=2861287 RepID=UPI001CA617C5|nr:HAMP domain-containing sensor histidine kinase [Bacillus sp. YC2]MBY8911513.1 HAMP domain-containing histidine kinase [Bacillus sp. YC2]